MQRFLHIMMMVAVTFFIATSLEAASLGCPSSSPSGLDSDCDSIPDEEDNCVAVPNGNCTTSVRNCDIDGNGIISDPEREGGLQLNSDQDSIGDACDDRDGDGLIDIFDSCPDVQNPTQRGPDDFSACTDKDFDGRADAFDNCLLKYNPDQKNRDNDTFGDACDKCPFSHDNGTDSDNDGIGDACENDVDNDTVYNNQDNCPNTPNRDQADSDRDRVGNVCDNCPNIANPNQDNVCFTPSESPAPEPAENILGGLPEQREFIAGGSSGCNMSLVNAEYRTEPISGFLGLVLLLSGSIGSLLFFRRRRS